MSRWKRIDEKGQSSKIGKNRNEGILEARRPKLRGRTWEKGENVEKAVKEWNYLL